MTFAVEWVVNITHESFLRVTCDETDDHAHPPDQDHAQSCVPHVGHPVQRLQCPAKTTSTIQHKQSAELHIGHPVQRLQCPAKTTSTIQHKQSAELHVGHPVQRLQCPAKTTNIHSIEAVSRTTCRTSGTSAPVPCKNHKHQSMQAVSRINALPTILDPTAAAGSYCSDTVTLGPVSRFGLMVKALGW